MAYEFPSIPRFNFELPLSVPPHPLEAEAWKSHFVLSATSQTEFIDLREKLDNTLAQQELEIALAQAVLDRLQEGKKALRSRIEKIDAAVASHRKLPPELLSKIFSVCVGDSPIQLPPPRRHRGRDAILNFDLSQVCSLWRQVALGTQILWNSIDITYSGLAPPRPLFPRQDRDTRLPSVRQMEDFSALPEQRTRFPALTCPPPKDYDKGMTNYRSTAAALGIIARGTRILRLEILPNNGTSVTINFPADLDPTLNLILPFASQFREITLICCTPRLLLPFLQALPSLFDSLESVRIVIPGNPATHGSLAIPHTAAIDDFETDSAVSVFRNAPLLRKFSLNGATGNFFRLFSIHPDPGVPWAQLTHISLPNTHLSVTNALWIIARSPCLTHCDFSIFGGILSKIPLETMPLIVHPALQSLIMSIAMEEIKAFYEHVTLPSLNHLEYSNMWVQELNPDLATSYMAFIARSRCPLQVFSASFVVRGLDLDPLLSTLPLFLQKLDVPNILLCTSQLLQIAQRAMFPDLEHIECTIEDSVESLRGFMEMVFQGGRGFLGSPGLRDATAHYTRQQNPDSTLRDTHRKFKQLSRELSLNGSRSMRGILRC